VLVEPECGLALAVECELDVWSHVHGAPLGESLQPIRSKS
jgi:hypothetical protein